MININTDSLFQTYRICLHFLNLVDSYKGGGTNSEILQYKLYVYGSTQIRLMFPIFFSFLHQNCYGTRDHFLFSIKLYLTLLPEPNKAHDN